MNNDLISRSELIKAFNEAQVEFDEYYKGLGKAKVITDNAPTQVVSSEKINCPQDLNQYLICEPIFENTFSPDECESRKFYGDCYHCFASSIAKRDRQVRQSARPQGEFTDLERKVIADSINYLLGAELLEENGYTEEVVNALKSVLQKIGAEEDHL